MESSIIILAGGKSSRMGQNKALLKVSDKMTVIDAIIEQMKSIGNEMILVANDFEIYQFLNVPMTKDIHMNKGPLGGIHAGLHASRNNYNLVTACDMPFISKEISQYLLEVCHGYDAVVPIIGGKTNPLFAVYHKRILTQVEENLSKDKLKLLDLLKELHVRHVDEQEIVQRFPINVEEAFFNMNNMTQYEQVLEKLDLLHLKNGSGKGQC